MKAFDYAAIAAHNRGVIRAIREYATHPSSVAECCTDAPCWKCVRHARDLLKVATNVDECAALLDLIDQGKRRRRSNAVECGTVSGYSMHRRRGEKPCARCRDAENAYQRGRYARRKEER